MPPSRLQQWLSPRPTRRTTTAHDVSVKSAGDSILYDFVSNGAGLPAVRETHYLAKEEVRGGKSGPPLHIHLRQDEHFEVEKGVLGVVVNGREHAVSKGDGRISVPSGARYVGPLIAIILSVESQTPNVFVYLRLATCKSDHISLLTDLLCPPHRPHRHRFWAHASSTEDLVFTVWVEPQGLDHGFDESFMRNFTGYLRDCERHKIAPSIFQILLFLYHADIVLTPPFWTPVWLLVVLHHFLAYWVGAGLLGLVACSATRPRVLALLDFCEETG